MKKKRIRAIVDNTGTLIYSDSVCATFKIQSQANEYTYMKKIELSSAQQESNSELFNTLSMRLQTAELLLLVNFGYVNNYMMNLPGAITLQPMKQFAYNLVCGSYSPKSTHNIFSLCSVKMLRFRGHISEKYVFELLNPYYQEPITHSKKSDFDKVFFCTSNEC